MKKLFKFIGITVGIILVIAVSIALFIHFRGIPSYEVEKITFEVKSTPEAIARGQKLAHLLCAGCHKNHETGKLTGVLMTDAPPEFGKIYSANITQDKTHGIGTWTDAELVYLLRTGIKRDGSYAPPYMAKLAHMADSDINAIIAFLHSDDPMVIADDTPDQACEPSFLTKFLTYVDFKPLPYPKSSISMPDTNNAIQLGRYLAHNLECFSCHSADFKTNDFMNPEKSVGYFGGGNKPLNREGEVMLTSNLTPDKETGIGTWSEEKFVKAIKSGMIDGQSALRYPMIPYSLLTDNEAKAIYTYLKTIPSIKNKIKRK